jgi:dephospho-CoA kinase
MLIIGLTGGIGSGKSTVAEYFAQLRIPVIDADRLAREMVVPGSPAVREIADVFGPDVILADGNLDRILMRKRVFIDPEQRRRLEAILHPRIYAEMRRRAQALHADYCILVIPLLLETGGTALVDRVLVVDAPEALQRERARSRDGMSDDILEAILRSQLSRAERLRAADDVIVNDGDLGHLQRQVAALHHRYLDLATAGSYPSKNH